MVNDGKARKEVIFEGVNGPFGCVGAMDVRWDKLVGNVVRCHDCF